MSGEVVDKNNPECEWQLDEECSGEVKHRRMFGKTDIPLCEKHMEQHKTIIFLHLNGYNIDAIMDMSLEDRKREALTIQLSGIAEMSDSLDADGIE